MDHPWGDNACKRIQNTHYDALPCDQFKTFGLRLTEVYEEALEATNTVPINANGTEFYLGYHLRSFC